MKITPAFFSISVSCNSIFWQVCFMFELNSEAGLSVRKELSRTIKEGEGGKFCDASVRGPNAYTFELK